MKLGEGTTPGPWEIEHRFIIDNQGDLVATCIEGDKQPWINNVRLIAKAPLLIECRDLLSDLRMYADLKLRQYRMEYSEDHCMVQTPLRYIAQIDALLAKLES